MHLVCTLLKQDKVQGSKAEPGGPKKVGAERRVLTHSALLSVLWTSPACARSDTTLLWQVRSTILSSWRPCWSSKHTSENTCVGKPSVFVTRMVMAGLQLRCELEIGGGGTAAVANLWSDWIKSTWRQWKLLPAFCETQTSEKSSRP